MKAAEAIRDLQTEAGFSGARSNKLAAAVDVKGGEGS
jgi:hypothetical protein